MAERFFRAGARVMIAGRRNADADAQAIGCRFIRTDVAIEDDVRRLVSETVRAFGQIDVPVQSDDTFA